MESGAVSHSAQNVSRWFCWGQNSLIDLFRIFSGLAQLKTQNTKSINIISAYAESISMERTAPNQTLWKNLGPSHNFN